MQQVVLAVSSIVVNAQPATPAAPTAGTVTQPTCATATGGSNHGYTASIIYFHTKCGSISVPV
jgi:hypothetical protein